MPNIDETIAFIQRAHADQTDKAGRPYYLHPLAVMRRLGDQATESEKLTALLHDIIEDTGYTADDLRRMGYGDDVVAAVELLSRHKGTDYLEGIRSLAESRNRIAIRVKIADNEENCDPARVAQLPPDKRAFTRRYEQSLSILRPALARLR